MTLILIGILHGILAGVFGVTLEALNAIQDGKNITLKCTTNYTDLLFIVSKCTHDVCTPTNLAECVFTLPHCMFYDAQHLMYYAIHNTGDGAELTITALTSQQYGTYTCAEIHSKENNDTLEVYVSKKDENHTIAYTFASVEKDENHTIAYTFASVGAFIIVVMCVFVIWCIWCKQHAINTYLYIAKNIGNALGNNVTEENEDHQNHFGAQNRGPQDVNHRSRNVHTSEEEIAGLNDATLKQPTIMPQEKLKRKYKTGRSTCAPTRSRRNHESIETGFPRSKSLKDVSVVPLIAEFERKEKQANNE